MLTLLLFMSCLAINQGFTKKQKQEATKMKKRGLLSWVFEFAGRKQAVSWKLS